MTFGSPTCYPTSRQSPLQLLTIDFPPLHHCVRASLFRQGGHAILRGKKFILLTKFHVRIDAPVMEGAGVVSARALLAGIHIDA